jgi:hypothetical protein
MTEQGILIAGGYGVVGQRIAADLGPDYEVIVAGRHLELAKATAAAIGHGVRSREIDVTVEASIKAALEGIATIVSCIDQPRRGLLHAAIERGLQYTDVTHALDGAWARRRVRGNRRRGSGIRRTRRVRNGDCLRHLERDGSCGREHTRRRGCDRDLAVALCERQRRRHRGHLTRAGVRRHERRV